MAIATLATDHAFARLGAHRVVATVDVLNTASIGVLRRVGFRLEATHREDVRLADHRPVGHTTCARTHR